jgi:hypothetical protein
MPRRSYRTFSSQRRFKYPNPIFEHTYPIHNFHTCHEFRGHLLILYAPESACLSSLIAVLDPAFWRHGHQLRYRYCPRFVRQKV